MDITPEGEENFNLLEEFLIFFSCTKSKTMIIIRKLLTFYKPKYTDMYCLMALGSTMGDWSLPRRHIDSNFRTQLFDFTLFFLKKK